MSQSFLSLTVIKYLQIKQMNYPYYLLIIPILIHMQKMSEKRYKFGVNFNK